MTKLVSWPDFRRAARWHQLLVNRSHTCALHGREAMAVCRDCDAVVCSVCHKDHVCDKEDAND